MVNTLVWPWKNDEELLEVRALLYPDNQHSDDVRRDRQQLGVNIVSLNEWISTLPCFVKLIFIKLEVLLKC
jgi:hypothetical protein